MKASLVAPSEPLRRAPTAIPDGTTDEMRSRLTVSLTQSEIVNIVLAIGMYNLTSRFLMALDINLEDIFADPAEKIG